MGAGHLTVREVKRRLFAGSGDGVSDDKPFIPIRTSNLRDLASGPTLNARGPCLFLTQVTPPFEFRQVPRADSCKTRRILVALFLCGNPPTRHFQIRPHWRIPWRFSQLERSKTCSFYIPQGPFWLFYASGRDETDNTPPWKRHLEELLGPCRPDPSMWYSLVPNSEIERARSFTFVA